MQTRKRCAQDGCERPRDGRSPFCCEHRGGKRPLRGCCRWPDGCSKRVSGRGKRYCYEHEGPALRRAKDRANKMRAEQKRASEIKGEYCDEQLRTTLRFMLGKA